MDKSLLGTDTYLDALWGQLQRTVILNQSTLYELEITVVHKHHPFILVTINYQTGASSDRAERGDLCLCSQLSDYHLEVSLCLDDDISNTSSVFFFLAPPSAWRAFKSSSPPHERQLNTDSTVTPLCQPWRPLCNPGSLQGLSSPPSHPHPQLRPLPPPKGQDMLDTDKMCCVTAAPPPPSLLAKLGAMKVFLEPP